MINMHYSKALAFFALPLLLNSCGNGKDLSKNFNLVTNAEKNTILNGDDIEISLKAKKNIEVDSVAYYLDDNYLGSTPQIASLSHTISAEKLGRKNLKAKVYSEGETAEINSTITVLSSVKPKLWGYEIINTYPHNTNSYTQGLEFKDGVLYESAGEYGKSKLLKVDYKTGEIEKEIELDNKYFAEGLTIIDNKLIQLTWKENVGFIYDLDTFTKTETFTYGESKEGWGLCNDGETIYKSDGSEKIWLLNPENLTEKGYLQIADNKNVRVKFNELEWVNGKIYANTYQLDGISIIDPHSGALEGLIDLRPLKDEVQSGLDKSNEVLNGIAYNKESNTLFVTGKHWNKLFEIRVFEK